MNKRCERCNRTKDVIKKYLLSKINDAITYYGLHPTNTTGRVFTWDSPNAMINYFIKLYNSDNLITSTTFWSNTDGEYYDVCLCYMCIRILSGELSGERQT